MSRSKHHYRVLYRWKDADTLDWQTTTHETREENNGYAKTLRLMGDVEIRKEFRNPSMGTWHLYVRN